MKTVEGNLVCPEGAKLALVASRFNHFIVDQLLAGAHQALLRHGADEARITVVRVPGAWEIPVAASRIAQGKKVDGIVALGAVIRGATPHFDVIVSEVSKGLAQVQMTTGIPVGFGVITTDTIEQAIERAGTKAGNKGWDAAVSAIEMVSLLRALKGGGL
ncbi:MAG TPA: 6,7-dimethyl-8-ribityllumazine synthase [Polyangiaceae bacterium]|jgi:6,7-dimethyl-8-ribityllumazine synthase